MSEAANGQAADNPAEEQEEARTITFYTMRRLVGVLGVALPFVLVIAAWLIFGTHLQPTMSDYYHTGVGAVFVGIMCAIGVFLFAYRGFQKKGDYDNAITNLAGVLAVGVAWFPTTPAVVTSEYQRCVGVAHYIFAAALFFTLAWIAGKVFTKTVDDKVKQDRRADNLIYKLCAWTIVVAIALIAVYSRMPQSVKDLGDPFVPKFVLEAVAVVAFGVSWLVKGRWLRKSWARQLALKAVGPDPDESAEDAGQEA